jgi:glycosyltransferase involved in cell wall biosynthesis
MMLSVIVPTCNRNDLLSECLERLKPEVQCVSTEAYEIIVSDDSKENLAHSLMELKYSWVRYVNGFQKGPAANRNNGAKHAKGEWLIFIDDDCLPDASFIKGYIHGIQQNPLTKVFEGAINADRERIRFDEEAPVNLQGGYLFSCNFAILKDYFNQLKGFDENFPFPAMEDTELAYRIKQDNNNFIFLKDALVVHPWRRKKDIVRMTLKRFDAALYFIKKHPEEKNKFGFRYYLIAFAHQTKGTIKYSFKFRFRGIRQKMVHDSMLIYFAFYMLLKRSA